tara:strand:- start:1093 stop:1809 length:717 start_codon:yes stop_codon:yes gene_type:complete
MPVNPYSTLNNPVAPPAPMAPANQSAFTPATQGTYNNLAMGSNPGNLPMGSGNTAANSTTTPVNQYDPGITSSSLNYSVADPTQRAESDIMRSAYGTTDIGGNVAGLAGQAAMGGSQYEQFIPDVPKAENEGEYEEYHEAAQEGFEDSKGEIHYGKKGARESKKADRKEDRKQRRDVYKEEIEAANKLKGSEKRAAKRAARKKKRNDRNEDVSARKMAYKSVKADIKMGTTYDDIKLD